MMKPKQTTIDAAKANGSFDKLFREWMKSPSDWKIKEVEE